MKNNIAIQASNNIEENKEIIKILESLGGNNFNSFKGDLSDCGYYYINSDNKISCGHVNGLIIKNEELILYTLEEYKKEFMESKEIKITPPEGYEIDKENSTFEKIIFKKIEKKLTYDNIIEKLFANKKYYYIGNLGEIIGNTSRGFYDKNPNNAPTSHQLQRLLAINKLMNIAYYLNDGWEPDWKSLKESKYCLYYDYQIFKIGVGNLCTSNYGLVYFKSKELAQQALKILGEETIKLALGVI